jgi:hypothetical protein
MTSTFAVASSAVQFSLSYISGSVVQLIAWRQLWDRLLQGSGAASGDTLQVGTSRTA